MNNKDINITNINILKLKQQRDSLLKILELIGADLLSIDMFDDITDAQFNEFETNIDGLTNMIESMIDVAEDSKPDQINEANLDKD